MHTCTMTSTGAKTARVERSTKSETGSERPERRPKSFGLEARAATALGVGLGRAQPAEVLALQRLAGNQAVASAIAASRRPRVTVQRHSSFEHAMMSNTKPTDAETTAGKVDPAYRKHVLEAERDRARFFKEDPAKTPDASKYPFEGVELIQLTGSKLWVTAGEITALADYLPNGEEINRLPAPQLQKVLQFMRHEIATNCVDVLQTGKVQSADTRDAKDWKGAQQEEGVHPIVTQSDAAYKIMVEDQATAGEGSQSYTGLLTRNACHFAPQSWERYTLHHNRAMGQALQSWQKGQMATTNTPSPDSVETLRTEQRDKRTQALVDGNYADHFLQDSFAAGHLTNKTLVMQWFLEWAQAQGHLGRTTFGLPNNDLGMSEKAQPGLAGEALYHQMDATGSVLKDGVPVAIDPQTASEGTRGGWEGRAEAIGVQLPAGAGKDKAKDRKKKKETVHNYQEMLRNAALNYTTGQPHDEFNLNGLWVKNRRGDTMFVAGDDSQDQKADPKGFEVPIEATAKSAKAVHEALDTGIASSTAEDCLNLVPTIIIGASGPKSLLDWNEQELRKECVTILFPRIWASTQFKELRILLSTHADTKPTGDWKATD